MLGDRACAMEVSSHALALRRTDGIRFAVAVFTNLTQDHLDFHADMEDYFAAKRRLFEGGRAERAVINLDDPYGDKLAAEFEALTFSAGGDERADLCATDVAFDASGSRFLCLAPGGEAEVALPLPGPLQRRERARRARRRARARRRPRRARVAALPRAERVPGRFEPVDEGQPFAVLVDYAHTPDSLENVLRAARQADPGGRAPDLVVFGCGGDRDRDKRPLMGRIGAELSDLAVVTSDNPRSEDPEAIIDEILAGAENARQVEVEPERRAAIALALGQARRGDVVVIAGKGHEQGQEFDSGRKIPFDDREVAREELRARGRGAAR